ncbi:hypothetical protein LCGC14_2391480, partial [marine sediment metagenome]
MLAVRSFSGVYILFVLVTLGAIYFGPLTFTWFLGLYLGIPAILGLLFMIPLSKVIQKETIVVVGIFWVGAIYLLAFYFIMINQDTIQDAVALYIKPVVAENYQSQRDEIETFIISSLPCNTVLNGSLENPERFTIVLAGENVVSGKVLSIGAEDPKDVYQLNIQSRIPNITVEALASTPENWNGAAVIFIHGLDLTPQESFKKNNPIRVLKPYTNEISLRLLDEGYMVVAPFVFSDEQWTQNARFFSKYSYHGVD